MIPIRYSSFVPQDQINIHAFIFIELGILQVMKQN